MNDDGLSSYASYLRTVLQRGLADGQPPLVTTDPVRLEEQARRTMNKKGFDYIRGGSGEGSTMDANRLAFRQWKIIPRVLKPTTPRDLGTMLFGHKYRMRSTLKLAARTWLTRSMVKPRRWSWPPSASTPTTTETRR